MSEDWSPKDPHSISNAIESLMNNVYCIQKDLGCPNKFMAQLLRRIADSLDDESKDYCHSD